MLAEFWKITLFLDTLFISLMILCSRIRWHVFGLGLVRNTKPKLPNQLSWTVNYFGVDVREPFDATIGMTTMMPPLSCTHLWCSDVTAILGAADVV